MDVQLGKAEGEDGLGSLCGKTVTPIGRRQFIADAGFQCRRRLRPDATIADQTLVIAEDYRQLGFRARVFPLLIKAHLDE